MKPHANKISAALEISSGHGRRSEYLINLVSKVILVDISPKCLEICRKRFSNLSHVDYLLTDGKSLASIEDESIDFIWSYDPSFTMEKDVYEAYFKEYSRILKGLL